MKMKFYLISYAMLITAFAGVSEASLFKRTYDVVLDATPIHVKPIESGVPVDAIEKDLETLGEPKAVVLFKINRVIFGEFTMLKRGGPSKLEQLNQAIDDKDILKVATLNFKDPDKTTLKGWLNIAVSDPSKTFGITSEEGLKNTHYRICLKRISERPDSYILIKSRLRE